MQVQKFFIDQKGFAIKFRRVFVSLLVLISLITTSAFSQAGTQLPRLKYTEFKLKNGLRVIMHQDPSVPIVAVNLLYHVGSKNEVPGRTGFAHLFEHMMFQGSKNVDDYIKPLDEAGAIVNGSTNADRTRYYEVLPSNYLERALFMEADRMGGLLEAMTQEKLDNQRDVVKNERRQSHDNQPYGTANEKIAALMYPANHPYHWTTIGSLDDLTAASQDDVKAFFRQYYVPNNATLVIAGDFNPTQARTWVEKYFGLIKSGAAITRPNPAQPKVDGIVRRVFEDSVQLPRVYMVWHTVPRGHKDEAAVDMLGAILSGGRGSRLQSNLVYRKQMVQDVSASHPTREIAGQFFITATARPGKTLDEIEQETNTEIERIKKEQLTVDEVLRAYNRYEAQTIFGLQTVQLKADLINNNAMLYGKPDVFQQQLNEYRKVTPADISRVANTYLTANHLVMSIVPRTTKQTTTQAGGAANTPTSKPGGKDKTKVDYTKNLPKPGVNPRFALPAIEKQKLSNGLEIWVVRQTELPIVSINMVFKSGGTVDPTGKTGLASLTAGLISNGTKNRTAVEIANQLQEIGATAGTSSDWDSANISMQTLTKNIDRVLDIYSDVIVNPTFPENELETARQRALIGLRQSRDNPNAIASVVYNQLLYEKNHPYGTSLGGTQASISSINQSDLMNFYQTYYRPNNAVLIVVGDTTMSAIRPKIESAFANWKPGQVPATRVPDAAAFDRPGIYVVDKPGAAQSVITIGQVGVSRGNPDFYALQVMNSILGGRLFMNLREDKGYTYGAFSNFAFRRGAGPFMASADVQTAVTKESIIEFLKELNGIRGAIPITPEEFEAKKKSLILGFPRNFETNGQITSQLSPLVTYNSPDSYFNDYITKVNAVTIADVNHVANKYLTPDKMAILVVGDRKAIELGLTQLPNVSNKIFYLDPEGNPVTQ
jgi:zinc protease